MRTSLIWKLLLVLAMVAAAVIFVPPLRVSALVLAGRSPACPLSQALQSEQNLVRQVAIKDEILKNSKLLVKDAQGFEQWQTPKGTFWISDGSRYTLPYNLAEMERKIYGSGQGGVQPGDIVLDCGAHVGTFVNEALQAGAKQVIAIEPATENLECLRRNFASQIKEGRVVVYPKGVWDKDDFLVMNVDSHNSAADSFVMHPEHAHESTERFPLTTIDKIVAELQLEKVDFIKMDIEGAETKALAGGRESIARFHPRLAIAAYHVPDHPKTIPLAVREAWSGYKMECGPCAMAGTFIRPDILYFHR